VLIPYPYRFRRLQRLVAVAGLGIATAFSIAVCAHGQAVAASGPPHPTEDRGRILLVLPFDNRTGQPSLEWIREAAAEILSSRFASAGFAPMRRDDRLYALDHLGLPQGFQPSRATALKLAQTLDADSIVVGSYRMDGGDLVAEARLVNVPHLRMSPPVTAVAKLSDMMTVFDSLAWKLTRQLDPALNISEQTFIAAGANMRLDAFEQYIRGITEPDQAERQRHLQQAVKLSPDFSSAWMALGLTCYDDQQYQQAADALAKVGHNDSDMLEAGFYRGLSLLFSGDYPKAEQAFAGVARILPLAEVVNNQGVAVSRQGHDGSALFRQAVTADPNNADYRFNLAVSLKHRGDNAEASTQLAQCLRLRPNDTEAQTLQAAWKQPAAAPGAGSGEDAAADPLERIARGFDAAAFRQAAQVVAEMDETRLAALPPRERALKLSAQAQGYLDRGLLLEAERLYQSAIAADGKVAEAHAGLAEVRQRSGDAADARKEARAALAIDPSAQAYLVLGRLDLAAGDLSAAGTEAGQALKLDPTSRTAQELNRQIVAKMGQRK